MYDADSKSDHLRYDAVSTLRQGKGSFVNLMAALCRYVPKGERTYVMITYVSKENNLGPDDEIRYIWGLRGPIFIL